MENIIRRTLTISLSFFITAVCLNCISGDKEESQRVKTIRLLAGDASKQWGVREIFENEIALSINKCDSSYVLTLKTDFSWEESYLYFQCPPQRTGFWELNDENNVITIEYISWRDGSKVQKKYAILDLAENQFTYEMAVGNTLKIIKLKPR